MLQRLSVTALFLVYVADYSRLPLFLGTSSVTENSSYGPSIFWILHEATALNLYNLRALICRQVLEGLKTHKEWSEEDKSIIIDTCAVCVNQEHPERFLCDLGSKQQQVRGKNRQRTNTRRSKRSIPARFASPGFPLLVHIQICLRRHEVERAAELTRKMDSSLSLNDEVKDEAWFSIWTYVLEEGILFLDGNLCTPGYLQKRDFLYNYMACRVSQQAKIAMIDFYQEVANRICEQEDSSLEEKHYVLLACQQTLLRLLLKMRGLGLSTIVEFVRETKWPIEIPGLKSETDLNLWSANFLLRKRDVPLSLIDETTGLVNLSKRFKTGSEKPSGLDLDSTFSGTKNESPSVPIESSTEENKHHELELSSGGDLSKALSDGEDNSVRQRRSVGLDPSCLPEAFHEEREPDRENEGDGDEDVIIVDEGDNPGETLVVESEDSDEVLEIDDDDDEDDDDDDDDGEDEMYDSHDEHSNEEENLGYSDDNEELTNEISGTAYLDEENAGSDEGPEYSPDDEEIEFLNAEEGEATWVQQKQIGSDDGDGQSEDEMCSTVGDGEKAINDSYAGVKKRRSDESNGDEESAESECVEIDTEDVEYDDRDRCESEGVGGRELSVSLKTENTESKNVLSNDHDGTDADHKHVQKAHSFRTGVAAVGGEFGDTTEEEDGNDRFKANSTAQADRLADTLRSGVGYASQVEDGYEPEDTHGYTEEEVSEAIHTEDEEDENTAKQKTTFSDTDTSQQQVGHAAHTNKEDLLVSEQPQDHVGNPDRQNSIEPTSDDMDMADEHTEQEEDVAAEFSELEENPDCSFESQKPLSESTQAKTLLEFAQKAQSKDNWVGLVKGKESTSEGVVSNRNDAQHVVEFGLLGQNPEFTKNRASSFDADDEKYATEGCKSLETEEEEDTEKVGVEILPREGLPIIDDSIVDVVYDDGDNDLKTGQDEKDSDLQGKNLDEGQSSNKAQDKIDHVDIEISVDAEENAAIGGEDGNGAVSGSNAQNDVEILDDGGMIVQAGEVESEVIENGDDHCTSIINEDKTDDLLPFDKIDSTEKGSEKVDNTGVSLMDEEVAEDVSHVNRSSDIHTEVSTAVQFEKNESQIENENVSSEIKHTENSEHNEIEDIKTNNDGVHSIPGTSFKSNNADSGGVESNCQDDEGSMQIDEVCDEDKPTVRNDGPSSIVLNPHPGAPDGDISNATSLEVGNKNEEDAISDTGRNSQDRNKTVVGNCIGSNQGAQPESVTEENDHIVLQHNTMNETSDTVGVKLSFEDNASQSIKKQSNEKAEEGESKKELPTDTGFSPNDEIMETKDPLEEEPSDIPKFIGGELEQRPSESTSKSETPADTNKRSDDDVGSLGDESGDNGDGTSVISGASAISEIFRTHGQESRERNVDDQSIISIKSISRSQKRRSNRSRKGATETTQKMRKPSTRSSTKASSGQASENVDEKNSAILDSKTPKTRGGLPPRPPKGTSDDPKRRTTRSKRKTDDALLAQNIKSTRSTRSSSRKLASGQPKVKDDDEDDDASVQTVTSTRSTRSSTRKLSSGTRATKQKSKDDEDDDASVQTVTSTRSTRSSTRKLSSGSRASKRKSKDDDDDDPSVQTVTSTRSTRSSTRNQASRAKKDTRKGTDERADLYSGWTVKKLQEELRRRGILFPSKARKKELQEMLAASDE